VSAERERLAALAAAAGYHTDVLATIAQATLPAYQPGEHLSDPQIKQVATAVEVLAQAGAQAATLPGIVAHYQRRYGPDWRDWFWGQQLRTANLRYQHPERYGPSPCDHALEPTSTGDVKSRSAAAPDPATAGEDLTPSSSSCRPPTGERPPGVTRACSGRARYLHT
jgi:hypothetical protein